MQIAVLGALNSWYVRDLRRAAADRHEVCAVTFRQLQSSVDVEGATATSGGLDLARADCVLVRTMPPGSLEQVVFRMDLLGRLESMGRTVINPARAIEAAVDKYLATAQLAQAGFLIPRTGCCQTADDAMAAFEQLGGDVVVKPLFGGEGRGLTRISDEALALRAFKTLEQLSAVIYLQEFIEHDGVDLRLLVVGSQVLGMKRRNPHDWRTNISRGAKAEPLQVDTALAETARRAAAAVGAPLAGVDLLPARDGQLYAIEVNAVPGWRALAKCCRRDVARIVLELLEQRGSTSDGN